MTKRRLFELMKVSLFIIISIYSVVLTVVVIRIDPNPIVIGIDAYGTRLISGDSDPIMKSEKVAFLKRFVYQLNNFDESTFDEQISIIGDFMGDELWARRKPEFQSISARMKSERVNQKAKIIDIREIDETHYEADLSVTSEVGITKSSAKIRVSLQISAAPRTITKPYPWQVTNYDEQKFD